MSDKDKKMSTEIMSMSANEFRRTLSRRRNGFEIEIFKAVPNDKISEQMDTSKNNLMEEVKL